jgi:hypothetical protein
MKRRFAVGVALLLFLAAESVLAGVFTNLDFELANTNNAGVVDLGKPYFQGHGPIEEILPGWHFFVGTNELSGMFFNVLASDPGGESIISKLALPDFSYIFPPDGFQGNYAFAVSTDYTPYVLSQSGQIPSDARVLYIAATIGPGARLEARIDGEVIDDGDISRFAGQEVELSVKMWLAHLESFGFYIGLDTITFAPAPKLQTAQSSGQLLLSWETALTNFVLQASPSLSGVPWEATTNDVTVTGQTRSVALPMDWGARFFRLKFVPQVFPSDSLTP